MVRLKNVSVWVEKQVDGAWKTAPEYDAVCDDDHNTITCYIESTEGVHFRIAYQDHRTAAQEGLGTWFTLYIDGNNLTSRCRAAHDNKATHHFEKISGYGPVSRPLIFSKLRTTDEEEAAELPTQLAKEIGSIVVNFGEGERREFLLKARPPADAASGTVNELGGALVWEKAAKGRDFNVILGQASVEPVQAVKPKTKMQLPTLQKRTFYIDSRDKPQGSFVFNYRSGDYLEAFSIKPPTTPTGAAAESISNHNSAFNDSPLATPTPVVRPKVDRGIQRVRAAENVIRHVTARPGGESETLTQKKAKVKAADDLQEENIQLKAEIARLRRDAGLEEDIKPTKRAKPALTNGMHFDLTLDED